MGEIDREGEKFLAIVFSIVLQDKGDYDGRKVLKILVKVACKRK